MRRGRRHLVEMWIRSGPMLSKLAHSSDFSGIVFIRRVVGLVRELRVNMNPSRIHFVKDSFVRHEIYSRPDYLYELCIHLK